MLDRIWQAWKAWNQLLRRVLTEPRSELTRWQRTLRFSYHLGVHGAKRLQQGRAQEMAAALSFRTLFGLLPVLVVGTLLVRAFQGWDRFYGTAERMLAGLGLETVQVSMGDGQSSTTLSQWFLDLLSQVETINLTAIGWVGVGVLIYSALGLMVTIEDSFNGIYHVSRGRSWVRRLPNYWFVLCLAPAAIAMMMYVDGRVQELIQQTSTWNWLLVTAGGLWSLGLTWLIMFAIYRVVPNTTVGTQPALAGAGVAATLLLIGKASLGAYLANALSIRQLYGSLGLIPLFMFWIYLMWLVVLYGLEVGAILQTVSRRELEELSKEKEHTPTGLVDPSVVLGVMEVTGQRFRDGKGVQPREIADALALPQVTVETVLTRLIQEGLLHRLDREDLAVTLALPPEQVFADRLIDVGFALADEGRPARMSELARKLRNAQREVAARASLASLLEGSA